jgi:RND family efflux transporter MFP subunit
MKLLSLASSPPASLLPAVAALALFNGCGRHSAPAPAAPPDLPAVPVRVVTVESRADTAAEEIPGTVQARQRAVIEAKVSGRIAHLHAQPGRRFAAGELLAELDAREWQARLDQAQATRDQAARDAERFRKLLAAQAVTAAEAEAVESRLRAAEAAVAEARTMLGYVRITAPFAGVVTRKLAEAGDLAMPGRPLAEMEDPAALRFEADIPESLAGGLALGARLMVVVGATEVEATVGEVAPAADPVTRTLLVKLDLPAREGWRSGQFGRVRVPVPQPAAVRVPASAVLRRGQLEFVHVVAGQRAQLRLVRIGRRTGEAVELLSGVNAGEQVIVDAPPSLREGQPVVVQP